MTALIHIAGLSLTINNHLRQRCAWCGATLEDRDLTRMAVPVGQDPRPGTWPLGALVAVDGNASYVVDHADGDPLPDGACGQLDPAATA